MKKFLLLKKLKLTTCWAQISWDQRYQNRLKRLTVG